MKDMGINIKREVTLDTIIRVAAWIIIASAAIFGYLSTIGTKVSQIDTNTKNIKINSESITQFKHDVDHTYVRKDVLNQILVRLNNLQQSVDNLNNVK